MVTQRTFWPKIWLLKKLKGIVSVVSEVMVEKDLS